MAYLQAQLEQPVSGKAYGCDLSNHLIQNSLVKAGEFLYNWFMKFSRDKPPIYQACVGKFGVDFDKGTTFTYGDTVYSKYPISPDLEAHEAVHVKQQESIGKDLWWDKYLGDPTFRLHQEIEAYQAQTKFIKQWCKDKNRAYKLIHKLALDLSGDMYGRMIKFSEAIKFIR